ncbi:MAG: hypothetical protein ABC537_01780 [Candidatus Methanosuratincola sp.]
MRRAFPSPLAILVSILVTAPIASTRGISWALVLPPILLVLDRLMRIRGVSRCSGSDSTSPFLLAFSRLLGSTSPGEALVSAFSTSVPDERLLKPLLALREGIAAESVVRRFSKQMRAESQTFEAIAALLSFDRPSSSERLRTLVKLREDRRKVRQDLEVRLRAISMRFKLLSMISSASLAVTAFASPLLGSFFSEHRLDAAMGKSMISFDFPTFSVFCSIALLSAYLPTKALPYVGGLGSALRASIAYFVTYLALVVAVGIAF